MSAKTEPRPKVVVLVCRECGDYFEHPPKRGRRPVSCPDCRAKRAESHRRISPAYSAQSEATALPGSCRRCGAALVLYLGQDVNAVEPRQARPAFGWLDVATRELHDCEAAAWKWLVFLSLLARGQERWQDRPSVLRVDRPSLPVEVR